MHNIGRVDCIMWGSVDCIMWGSVDCIISSHSVCEFGGIPWYGLVVILLHKAIPLGLYHNVLSSHLFEFTAKGRFSATMPNQHIAVADEPRNI